MATVKEIPPPRKKEPSFKKVAAYCRVSTKTQKQLDSLVAQENYYEDKIKANPDWQFAGIYSDVGSGTTIKGRKRLNALISACRRGKVDMVLIKAASRFARNTVDALKTIRMFRRWNVDIYFEKEDIHSIYEDSEFLLTVICAQAQDESESKSADIKWGLQKSFVDPDSKYYQRKCYGYRHNEKGQLVINENEAEVVKLIFRMSKEGANLSKIAQTLDYLYEIIDNSKENAADHLQIQKMDARNAEIEQIDENIIAISPRITGEAVKIVEQQKHAKDDEQLSLKIQEYVSNKGNSKTSKALELINTLSEAISRSPLGFQYENALVLLIAAVLKDTALDGNKRSELCGLWLNGIRRLFSGGSFVADVKLCPVLFQQLNSNASLQTKNEIKLLMLDTLLYLGQSGVISEISKYAQDYLQIDENTARAILNTIVKLSEDEMAHQKYNANYLKKRSIRGSGNFIPNMTPKLTGIDTLIRNDRKGKVYTSQRDAIIIQYLYEESPLDIKTFSMQNFDLSTLCSISNCGVSISDPVFNFLMREIIFCIVDVWHFHRGSHDSHKVLDLYCTSEIIALYRRQLVQSSADSECAIDLLFTDIDFSKFTDETIEFYQDIFGNFLPEFLDAWQNSERRCIYKKKIQYLEQKVNGIEDEHVRIQLYKSLFFSITRYCTVDLSQCPTNYSYEDICFLNGQFSKYGKYHLQEMLQTVYQLHIDELLPHILNSINDCFSAAKSNLGRFATIIRDNRWIVQLIIYKAFIKYSEEIKNDYQLTLAYENILETLVTLNYEDAAVLLDEFRLH